MRRADGYDKTDKLTSIKSYAADALATDPPLDETYYWYDRRGLLIKASNLAALVEFERDGNGRIIRETTNRRSIESKLDTRGNRIERRIGGGEPSEGLVKIGRDPLGMVASIAIDDHAPLVFTRDALGRETSRTSAKGFRLEQSFDAVGQLMHQRVGAGQIGQAAAERRYGWDKAGAPTSIDDANWGETRYTYDVNGQVAKAEFGDGFSEKFAYDPAKNVAGVALQGPGLDASVSKLFAWRSTPGGVVQLARGPNCEMVALTHDELLATMIERNAMSRTEELQQKLRNKSFDPGFSDFNAKVEDFLEVERLASAGSTAYMKNLYNKFSNEKPDNFDLWLTKKMKDHFISEKEKPFWPCEPDWCFFNEEPMVFLHQFTDRDGVSIFVFRSYDATDIGARAVYKMIAQDKEGKIVLSGDIRG